MAMDIGSWELGEPLGERGVGRAHIGVHRKTGAHAVVKVLREPAGSAQNTAQATLRREIRALTHLDHPGIVKVLEHGFDPPWYAMELVEGQSLRQWVTDSDAPRNLDKAVAAMRALCRPLAHLHGHGLVHRDLRPDNILVRPSGEVVLVDFDRMVRHTFTAVHQDARSDLRALGSILHELLIGTPPPEDVDEHSLPPLNLPPLLRRLLTRLLARHRRDRIAYVADVERALAKFAGEEPSDAAHVYYLYRPGLSGRDADLARIATLADEVVVEGNGRLVQVAGERGVGKTRFLAEVAWRVQERGFTVIKGHGEAAAGTGESVGALLHPLRGIARVMLERCHSNPGVLSAPTLKLIAQIDPRFGDVPEAAFEPEPPLLPPEAARYRLFVAALQVLRSLADPEPLALLLDDLHWADPFTLAFLDFLEREQLAGLRVLVVGTQRLDRIRGPEEMLAPDADRITLGALDESAVSEMLQDMLGLNESMPELARYLTDHTGGNAFFVGEFLRSAIAEGLLWRDGERGWRLQPAGETGPEDYDELNLPDSMHALVRGRIARLPQHARAIAEAAAVLGREVPLDLLAPTTGLPEGLLLGGLANLLRVHVLTESTASSLRFTHEQVREVAYAALSPDRRRALHRVAALALEADAGTWRNRLGELGQHWENAGESTRAHGVYLAGARVAVARNGADEAEILFGQCLRLASSADARVAPLLELGSDVLWAHGRMEEAAEVLRDGVDAAREAGNRSAEALGQVWLGRTVHVLGDLDLAVQLATEARLLAREIAETGTEGLATARLASLHHSRGETSEALELYKVAARLHRMARDRRSLGETLGNRALLLQEQLGDFEAAMPLHTEALAIHRHMGNRRAEGHVLGNLALAHHRRGKNEKARQLWDSARAILQEVGDRTFEAIVVSNQAVLAVDEGRSVDARALFAEALSIHEEVGNRHVSAMVRCEQARFFYEATGEYQAAEDLLNDSEALFVEVGDHLNAGLVQIHRAGLGIARGEPAEPHLEVARSVVESLGGGPASHLSTALARIEERL